MRCAAQVRGGGGGGGGGKAADGEEGAEEGGREEAREEVLQVHVRCEQRKHLRARQDYLGSICRAEGGEGGGQSR